jgi:hypothetical protein
VLDELQHDHGAEQREECSAEDRHELAFGTHGSHWTSDANT